MTARFVTLIPIVGFFGLWLTGCAAQRPSGAGVNPIPVRDFLQGRQEPSEGYGAYGYILFSARPDSLARIRYLAICRAFKNELPAIGGFETLEKQSLAVTYWMMDSLFIVARRGETPDSLVDHYNYERAMMLLSAVGKVGTRGPLMVAWRTAYHAGIPSTSALIMDMTSFEDADVARAFAIWRERITSSPEQWAHGFVLKDILIAFSGIVNKYGENVFSVIKDFKSIFAG